MKATLIILNFSINYLQSPAQVTQHSRGMYVDRFFRFSGNGTAQTDIDEHYTTIGYSAKETALLEYARDNHINYLLLYDVYPIINNLSLFYNGKTLGNHLCDFIKNAKDNYCIDKIGVAGSNPQFFQNVISVVSTPLIQFTPTELTQIGINSPLLIVQDDLDETDPEFILSETLKFYLRVAHFNSSEASRYGVAFNGSICNGTAHFDVITTEYEFWNNNADDDGRILPSDKYPYYQTLITAMDGVKNSAPYPLLVESYVGVLDNVTQCDYTGWGSVCSAPACPDFVNHASIAQWIDGIDQNTSLKRVDRIMTTYYSQLPHIYNTGGVCGGGGDFYSDGYYTKRFLDFCDPSTENDSYIIPIFASQSQFYDWNGSSGTNVKFLGDWFSKGPSNNIWMIEKYFYDEWIADVNSNVRNSTVGNDVVPGTSQWFSSPSMLAQEKFQNPFISNSPVCSGVPLTFTYQGPIEDGYQWDFFIEDGTIPYTFSSMNNTWDPYVSPTEPILIPSPPVLPDGDYTAHLVLRYKNDVNCSKDFTMPIHVGSGSPTIELIASDESVCAKATSLQASNESVILQALSAPGATYSWSFSPSVAGASINPSGSICVFISPNNTSISTSTQFILSCTITNTSGCNLTQYKTITVHPNPTLSAVSNCSGSGTQVVLSISGSTANATIDWSDHSTSPTLTVSNSGLYSVLITQNSGGCTQLLSYGVGRVPVAPVLTPSSVSFCTTTSSPFTLTISNPQSGVVYKWYRNGVLISGATLSSYTETSTLTNNMTYYVTASGQCTATSNTVNVTISTPPVITAFATPTSICAGETSVIQASGGLTYSWNPGSQSGSSISVQPTSTTIYTVTGTDANSCSTTATVTVNIGAYCCTEFTLPFTATAGSFSNQNFNLNTSFNLTGNLTLSNCTLAIAQGVQIIVPANFTLTINNNSDLHACGQMWGGIINQGGTVVVNSSSIRNAITAVQSSGGSPVRVEGSTFDQNWIGISLNDGSYAPGTSGTYIRNSTFKCSGGGLIGSPFDQGINRPCTHIQLTNVIDLIIGDVNYSMNHFYTASTGIYGKVSAFQVVNANFDYSEGGLYTNRQGTTAIYGTGEGLDKDGGTIRIGGSANYEACVFNFWETGIRTTGVGEVFLSNNYLNDCITGSSISSAYHSEQSANTIYNFRDGLGIFDPIIPQEACFSCFEHQVFGNYFNMGASYLTDPFAETAIDAQHSILAPGHGSSGGTIRINDNYINNSRIGVHIRNFNSAEIENVTYTTDIDEPAISDMNYGIWVENSNYSKIISNHMVWLPPNPIVDFEALRHFQRGIAIEESYRCELRDNVITSMSTGITAKHNCEGSDLYCNQMNDCFYGIFLDENSPTSYLTTQGIYTGNQSNDETWKNEWVNNVNLKIGGTIWQGNPLNWIYDPSMSPDFSPIPSPPFVIPREGDLQNSCTNSGTPEELLRNEMFGAVAGDSTSFDMDSVEFVVADNEAFLVQMTDEPDLLTLGVSTDAIYQTAFTAILQSNSGKYEEVKTHIVDKNMQQASMKLAVIQDENLIDQNKRTIASILISLYDPALDMDSDTVAIVSNVALQHPFYGGEAVYWARGILRMNVRDLLPPMRRRKPTKDAQELAIQNDFLYPNPATGEVTYTTSQGFKKAEMLKIKDNTGRETGSIKLPENLNFYKISISHLQPGIYYITRFSENRFIEEHKLIILN